MYWLNEFCLHVSVLNCEACVVGQVGDLGFASELGNYAEYSGAPNEEETLQYARALIDVSAFWTFYSNSGQ